MTTLNNWNHKIQFEVADNKFKTPTQISDVQDIVKQASSQNQPVTVVGAMHSTTECMVGGGIVISMKKMARVLSVDEQNMTVTVQAGATLHEVCSHLKGLGLQLPVILEFGNFQIGAMSGTHANDTSMTRSAQFSSHVAGVKLVTPAGDIMEISEEQNTEYLPAVRSHFGMLGVVCEVTVRLFKTQPLHVGYQIAEVNSFLDGFASELETLKAANDQVFGMIFPNSGKLLWQCRKFVEPVKPNPHSLATWLDPIESKGISLFGDLFLPLLKAITADHPSAAITGLGNAMLVDLPLKIIQHSSYTIDPCNRGIIYHEDDPGFEFYDWVFPERNWVALVREFLELSKRFRQQHKFISPLPALIYFLKQDQASLLSRSRDGNAIAVDPLYPDPSNPTWKEFRGAFNEIAMRHGGIPHINKTRDGAIDCFAKACDQESLKRYLEIRKKFDPKNLFLNGFFKKMFAKYL
ncbi:FAD-binding domain-containing protein [Achaetomium macrosporum]|uniref:D-arabinono-1,4-lactone oxidase n=1 Tax=Achaetomium macrosporum TaxID=79813 RepID=A0AAN7HA21_9PEZI|nr:FAD-binding domain-containing protein [Achaetomium macrosporum]